MTLWRAAAIVLTLAFAAAGRACARGPALQRLAALELASLLAFLLLAVTEGLHARPFLGTAVTLAIASFTGSLTLTRFLERWL